MGLCAANKRPAVILEHIRVSNHIDHIDIKPTGHGFDFSRLNPGKRGVRMNYIDEEGGFLIVQRRYSQSIVRRIVEQIRAEANE